MSSKIAIARAYFAARYWRKNPRRQGEGPVCDEAEMAAHFEKYNALGIALAEARRFAYDEAQTGVSPRAGYSFGLSTGTTGAPGVFLTTEQERDRWLGTILGKYLSPGQLVRLNAALLLKHNNSLYNVSPRVHYFDLTQPVSHWAPRLCDLAPNVLIGPASVLLALADSPAYQRRSFHPEVLIAAAEALFPQDRERLEMGFHVAPRNLYQSKEGFLAAGCVHGAMHWNEDLITLEVMRFKDRRDRVVPVITDFTRQSQTFRRFRIDDVLVIDEGAQCGCRTPFQEVATVEGRLQDILLRDGRPLFPLDLNLILRPIGEYTLKQHDSEHFTLECAATPSEKVRHALETALLGPKRLEIVPLRPDPAGRKRRRFQRLFDPQNTFIVEQLLEPPRPLWA